MLQLYEKIIFGMLLLFFSCSNDNDFQNALAKSDATIHYDPSGIDNCTYIIKLDNKSHFTVSELENEFRADDLKVIITYYETDDIVSCGFAGSMRRIEIVAIKKI